ncbi:MAG: YeiH family putative sulfate export transporter [Sulfuricurvum sp. PD_MW2]|uniref:YeiH family protein n=1 Tax=Sulfuricurvum sp. PD_MW2 TaxID=2027917 RepID=UPI000C05D234|nr:YeiH family protein [Sulfuricurvum sp. PD_MW2]PHM17143.1 MAG: YeiH family putative sulfate export transporter [Sulfuricurvum sp. PD_MW2]
MPFSPAKRKDTLSGILFVAIFASAATMIADLSVVKHLGISPLVVGIVLGIFFANTMHNRIPSVWESGITFSGKKILRFAIVFYGFRITFQQIAEVGMEGFMVSLIMLSSTFILGTYLGQKIFKLDRDTSMLTASGASVCGAAAVLATEPVLKSEEHKAAIAVSMVVLFGTIAMFLYPALYSAGVFAGMDDRTFGIFVGGTIHEVAQVVAVGGAYGKEAADAAVIVKMTRVIMIAPMLIVLGIYLSYAAKKSGASGGGVKLVIPWFAVYFIGMAGVNSLLQQYSLAHVGEGISALIGSIVSDINMIDTFLLTMAMTALGMGTRFAKFKGLGLAPLYTAGAMFAWLLIGGYFITTWVVATF